MTSGDLLLVYLHSQDTTAKRMTWDARSTRVGMKTMKKREEGARDGRKKR